MPNWCSNSVVFAADEEKLERINQLFADIENKQVADEQYHLPSFATGENGFMQDIIIDHYRIMFETRWLPNTELLIEIADFYKAGFINKFQQMENGIYGEARYQDNTLTMVSLDIEDLKAIRYDRQKKGYPCGEHVFEFEGDLLDYILEQKELDGNNVQAFTIER